MPPHLLRPTFIGILCLGTYTNLIVVHMSISFILFCIFKWYQHPIFRKGDWASSQVSTTVMFTCKYVVMVMLLQILYGWRPKYILWPSILVSWLTWKYNILWPSNLVCWLIWKCITVVIHMGIYCASNFNLNVIIVLKCVINFCYIFY